MNPVDFVLSHCPVRERVFSTIASARRDYLVTMAALYLGRIKVVESTMREVLVPNYPIEEMTNLVFGIGPGPAKEFCAELLVDCWLPELDLAACAHVVANINSNSVGGDHPTATAPYWIHKWNSEWSSFGSPNGLPLDVREKVEAVFDDVQTNDEVVEAQSIERDVTEIRWIWGRELQWLSIRGILCLCTRTVQEAIERFPTDANAKIEQLIELANSLVSGEFDVLGVDVSYDEFDSCVMEYAVFTEEVADVKNFVSKGGPRGVVGSFIRCLGRLAQAAQATSSEEELRMLGAFLREASLLATGSTIDNFFEVLEVDSSRFPELGSSISMEKP